MPQWLINKELNDMPTVQFLKMGFMVKVATTSIVIIQCVLLDFVLATNVLTYDEMVVVALLILLEYYQNEQWCGMS